jgi:hypothetical protein
MVGLKSLVERGGLRVRDRDLPLAAAAGPLIGRDRDADYIGSFVDRAASEGGAILVEGEAGVGKTALLELAAARAQAAGGVTELIEGEQPLCWCLDPAGLPPASNCTEPRESLRTPAPPQQLRAPAAP